MLNARLAEDVKQVVVTALVPVVVTIDDIRDSIW